MMKNEMRFTLAIGMVWFMYGLAEVCATFVQDTAMQLLLESR